MYKLTRGSVSVLRADEDGARAALEEGFALDGLCDANGVVIDANVTLKAKAKAKKDPEGTEE